MVDQDPVRRPSAKELVENPILTRFQIMQKPEQNYRYVSIYGA